MHVNTYCYQKQHSECSLVCISVNNVEGENVKYNGVSKVQNCQLKASKKYLVWVRVEN